MEKIVSPQAVYYIGQAHVREIDTPGWRDASVSDVVGKFTWHKGNGWAIPADHFTDAAMTYFSSDPEFVVRDVDVPRVD